MEGTGSTDAVRNKACFMTLAMTGGGYTAASRTRVGSPMLIFVCRMMQGLLIADIGKARALNSWQLLGIPGH